MPDDIKVDMGLLCGLGHLPGDLGEAQARACRDAARRIVQLEYRLAAAEAAATKHGGEWLVQSNLEAEIARLRKLIDDAASHWLGADLEIPFEGAIDGAMKAAINEIKSLRKQLTKAKGAIDFAIRNCVSERAGGGQDYAYLWTSNWMEFKKRAQDICN